MTNVKQHFDLESLQEVLNYNPKKLNSSGNEVVFLVNLFLRSKIIKNLSRATKVPAKTLKTVFNSMTFYDILLGGVLGSSIYREELNNQYTLLNQSLTRGGGDRPNRGGFESLPSYYLRHLKNNQDKISELNQSSIAFIIGGYIDSLLNNWEVEGELDKLMISIEGSGYEQNQALKSIPTVWATYKFKSLRCAPDYSPELLTNEALGPLLTLNLNN